MSISVRMVGRYPAYKLVLVGAVEGNETPVSVLVKFSHQPSMSLAVDDLIKVTQCELRSC